MRCHKERREVLCATNDSTLVYGHHIIHLSTYVRQPNGRPDADTSTTGKEKLLNFL